MSYCPECGEEVPEVAKFCPSCGESLEQVRESDATDEDEGAEEGASTQEGLVAVVALVVVILLLILCNQLGQEGSSSGETGSQDQTSQPTSVEVSRSDFGEDWPLTVSSGVLRCEAPQAVVFSTGDQAYAVNGMANTQGYQEIDAIWRDNPDIQGAKINIGPLIDRGLELCQ